MSQQHILRFQQGIDLAQQLGIEVRYAYLEGAGGGLCQIKDKPCLFVDLALDIHDQLDRLQQALNFDSLNSEDSQAKIEIESWNQGTWKMAS